MSSELIVLDNLPEEAASALSAPTDRALTLFQPFVQPFQQAAELLITVPEALASADTARALRLKLVKARTAISRTKDSTKADIKVAGNIIDWYHRRGTSEIEAAESQLLEVEKAEERREAERKARLRLERLDRLAAVDMDGTPFPLAEMAEDDFLRLYETAATARQARINAERRAAEERLAREQAEAELQAQREAQRLAEVQRVAEERAKAEAQALAERQAREELEVRARAERQAHELKLAEERAKHEARLTAERMAREAVEAKARAEREAADREKVAQALAERRAREEAEAAQRRAEQAPDREKLVALAEALARTPLPQMTTHAGYQILKSVHGELIALINSIHQHSTKLQ